MFKYIKNELNKNKQIYTVLHKFVSLLTYSFLPLKDFTPYL